MLFSVGIVYQSVSKVPIKMETGAISDKPISVIDYEGVPVFLENLRFNHNNISYFINDSCSGVFRVEMVEAFDLFEWMTKYISFYEVDGDADIDVGCSDEFIVIGEGLFAAGEGGPSRIINTSRFRIIEKGNIWLYDNLRCDYPIVELHELGHVFGFEHSDDPSNIMYSISDCGQRVTADMIELIDVLYSIEPLADVWISSLSSIKRGRYLDFNMTVLNEGLVDASDVDLGIVVDEKVVKVLNLGEIKVGFGRTLFVENLKLPSSDFGVVDFYVDIKNKIREIDEGNNFARISEVKI